MIPVGVRDQECELHRARAEFLVQGEAERTNAGTGIENDDLAIRADFDAAGVSAVTARCSDPALESNRARPRISRVPEMIPNRAFSRAAGSEVREEVARSRP